MLFCTFLLDFLFSAHEWIASVLRASSSLARSLKEAMPPEHHFPWQIASIGSMACSTLIPRPSCPSIQSPDTLYQSFHCLLIRSYADRFGSTSTQAQLLLLFLVAVFRRLWHLLSYSPQSWLCSFHLSYCLAHNWLELWVTSTGSKWEFLVFCLGFSSVASTYSVFCIGRSIQNGSP